MNGENVSSAYGCLLRIRDKKERNPLFYRIPLQIKEAIDGTRTRDFHLGKVALYQLSHYRINTSVALEHCSLTTKMIIAWVEPAVNPCVRPSARWRSGWR